MNDAFQRTVWYTAAGAGLVTPLVLMVAELLNSLPALKYSSAANGETAELEPVSISIKGVCARETAAKAQVNRTVANSAPKRERERIIGRQVEDIMSEKLNYVV